MPLPHRPWIRDDVPVVWRSDTCIEMGWPPREVRVDRVTHADIAWLLGLHGERELDQALGAGRELGVAVSTMRRLLRAGVACGLVDDASSIPDSLREVAVQERDRLAGDLAAARHLHGETAHAVIDRRQLAEVAIQGEGLVAEVITMVLATAGVGSILGGRSTHSASKRHRHASTRRACHVVCDSAHPDAASDVEAMALDIPHLAVTAAGGRAVIGPLVIPGRTSCLRCRDLHMADADPTWSRVAVQWSARKPGAVASGLAYLAGAWAALQVLALIDAGPECVTAPTLDGALIINLPEAQPALESRPAHPLCGCRWPRTGRGISA
jgi:hypothetical protein